MRGQSVQPEEGAGTKSAADAGAELDVDLAAVDLKERAPPDGRLIIQALAWRQSADPAQTDRSLSDSSKWVAPGSAPCP
jgi:hypothetical protein